MLWMLALVLANVCIAGIEMMNRQAGENNFLQQLWYTGPLILVSQFGLYFGFKEAPGFWIASATFTIGNTMIRVLNSYYFVGEPPGYWTWWGILLMLVGGFAVKYGEHA